jgi:hypothetical protein
MAGGGGAGRWGGAPLRSIVHFASDSRPPAPSRLSITPRYPKTLVKGVRAMCFSRGRARLCTAQTATSADHGASTKPVQATLALARSRYLTWRTNTAHMLAPLLPRILSSLRAFAASCLWP